MSDNQVITVPRDEVERLVKLLQYQAHPYPSPHAEFWQGLLDTPVISLPPEDDPDPVLCDFYEVTDYPGLVRELVGHVSQLQESAKHNVKPWEDTFPPTLLPAYIERVNAANFAAQIGEPVVWGTPKTVRQLVRQLETLDQDLRPLSMLRVPASVFEDGKERVRATHLSFSHERVDGQWLAPFKSDGEKVLAFWCRMEQTAPTTMERHERSPKDYAIEHSEYMAASADHVMAEFQAYGLALMAVDEGGDDGEGELFDAVDSARQDLQDALVTLRSRVYEFRKRRDRIDAVSPDAEA